jgi:hypothetical protein
MGLALAARVGASLQDEPARAAAKRDALEAADEVVLGDGMAARAQRLGDGQQR